jgi:hypothetical protein
VTVAEAERLNTGSYMLKVSNYKTQNPYETALTALTNA